MSEKQTSVSFGYENLTALVIGAEHQILDKIKNICGVNNVQTDDIQKAAYIQE